MEIVKIITSIMSFMTVLIILLMFTKAYRSNPGPYLLGIIGYYNVMLILYLIQGSYGMAAFNAFIVSVWIFLYKQNKNTERIRNELTDTLIDMYCMNPKLDKSDFTKVNSNGRIEIHYKGEPFDPESHL